MLVYYRQGTMYCKPIKNHLKPRVLMRPDIRSWEAILFLTLNEAFSCHNGEKRSTGFQVAMVWRVVPCYALWVTKNCRPMLQCCPFLANPAEHPGGLMEKNISSWLSSQLTAEYLVTKGKTIELLSTVSIKILPWTIWTQLLRKRNESSSKSTMITVHQLEDTNWEWWVIHFRFC